ncbi:hypothetical protein Bca4012_007460 [Brassica carinata]
MFLTIFSSHCLSSAWCCHMMSSLWANNSMFIQWFSGQLGGLDQNFDESFFSLIGEYIISIIVVYNLPTNNTWWFCVVNAFPWLVRHGILSPPYNCLRELQLLWNKKRGIINHHDHGEDYVRLVLLTN